MTKALRFALIAFSIIFSLTELAPIARAQSNDQATVIQEGPANYVSSPLWLEPTPGTPGFNAGLSNYIFYVLPGMGAGANKDNPQKRSKPLIPFDIAYANNNRPLGTNKWWSQVGLQWSSTEKGAQTGFAFSWNDGLPRTLSFVDEPYYMQFIDYAAKGSGNFYNIDIAGMRLVNLDSLYVNTSGKVVKIVNGKSTISTFAPTNVVNQRGPIAEPQPVVTVGLQHVHPLGTKEPTQPPWTNVKVDSYSDWGVVMSYTDSGNKMQITAASGSPYLWFERVQGSNAFEIVAGSTEPGGALNVWSDSGPNLGLTVTNNFLPAVPGTDLLKGNGIKGVLNTADYAIYADAGTWVKTKVKGISVFVNSEATKVAVLAIPHSVTLQYNSAALIAAADMTTGLGQYACRKITNTQIDYPPIAGSMSSTTVGQQMVPLGYFQTDGLLRYQLRVSTDAFSLPGCDSSGPALQMLMPHHVAELYPGQNSSIQNQYQWHGLVGPLVAFVGNSFVEQLSTLGTLSIFPAVLANNNSLTNPLDKKGELAIDDVYSTMTNWFYREEGNVPTTAHLDSYVRNLGNYDNVAANTYEQKWETLIDSAVIADQLAQSPVLQNEKDNFDDSINQRTGACLCMPKSVVAEQMRNKILQDMESLLAQWFDIYTAHLFQYIPQFYTIVGFPDGYGAVQDINDHHFHYGYFLRAAALIGRYDPNWLAAYKDSFDLLRQDVANFDRANQKFPFLRNFDVYSGHSWAAGDAGDGGENQESTSEAVNFEAGVIELAQLENDQDMLAVGELLYEQEIRGAQNYWFNVDADLTKPVPVLPFDPNDVIYNGNWPAQWVTYNGPNAKKPWHVTLGGIYRQTLFLRSTFFGGADTTYAIQNIPMSSTGLWQGRDQEWLNSTWTQFLLDAASLGDLNKTADENIFADIQARLAAGSDTSINGTGLKPALERIANPHAFAPYATNTMAKYWAYTNSLLGQLDPSVRADQPDFAVFVNGSGQQTFVAYNPGTTPMTITFYKDSDGTQVTSFSVPAGTVVSQGAAGSTSFKPLAQGPTGPTNLGPEPGRLYLQSVSGQSLPLTGTLTDEPGTWLPSSGTSAFPSSKDLSAIMPSLTVIPVSTGNCADIFAPGTPGCPNSNAAYGKWVGSFSGTAIGDTTLGEIPHTTFAIYADPALGAGWQTNPATLNKNTTHVLVNYWFDKANYPAKYPDRIEEFHVGSNASNNTFVIGANEITDYYFGCYANFQNGSTCDSKQPNPFYGNTALSLSLAQIVNFKPGVGVLPITPYPSNVDCGIVEVDVYGSAGSNQRVKAPLPVSTGTDPLLGRASWVRPPYNGGSCVSPSEVINASAAQ